MMNYVLLPAGTVREGLCWGTGRSGRAATSAWSTARVVIDPDTSIRLTRSTALLSGWSLRKTLSVLAQDSTAVHSCTAVVQSAMSLTPSVMCYHSIQRCAVTIWTILSFRYCGQQQRLQNLKEKEGSQSLKENKKFQVKIQIIKFTRFHDV